MSREKNGKERKTSYVLAILLNIFSLLFLLAGIFYWFYGLIGSLKYRIDFGYPQYEKQISTGILIFAIGQYVFLRVPLKKMLGKSILDNEYDEFGRSKKKKFENLTRKEREAMDFQKAALMEQLLSTSVLKKITKEGSSDPESDLNSMIGLENVKQKIVEMNARMKFEKEAAKEDKAAKRRLKNSKQYGMNGRHFVFYGSPGTGKTQVARIIAGYLYKNGYTKQNKVIEINGGFLKAGEDSETKTKLVIQQAYGGVLFIDEAYSIVEGNSLYGRAVIAELIKEMEDNRDKFTVILAGYKKDIKRLLDENEGFKSRIKEYLEFTDYNIDELKQIFESMAHASNFAVSVEAMDNFEVRISKEQNLSSYGNGRTVRNILDESIDRHALNYGQGKLSRIIDGKKEGNDKCKFILCGCDVSTAPNRQVL